MNQGTCGGVPFLGEVEIKNLDKQISKCSVNLKYVHLNLVYFWGDIFVKNHL